MLNPGLVDGKVSSLNILKLCVIFGGIERRTVQNVVDKQLPCIVNEGRKKKLLCMTTP